MLFSLVTIDNIFERPPTARHTTDLRPPVAQALLPSLFFTSLTRHISEQAKSSPPLTRALQLCVLSCNYKRPFSQAVCFEAYTNAWGYTANFPKMEPLQTRGPRSDQTSGWPAASRVPAAMRALLNRRPRYMLRPAQLHNRTIHTCLASFDTGPGRVP